MEYYVLVSGYIYFLGILEIIYKNKSITKFITFCIATILIVLVGLKIDGSTDYFDYKILFNQISEFDKNGFIEPGFQILILLIHHLGGSFIVFYFVIALINISIKSFVFYKLSPYIVASFLIYFCGCLFERDNDGIRQGLSMSFCFLALYYLYKNKDLKFIIFTVIAVTIHYSSFIFFLAYWLKKIKLSNKLIIWIILGAYVISISGVFFTKYFISFIPIDMASSKLDIYSSNKYSEGLGITIGLIFRTILLFLFINKYKKININNKLYLILRNGLAFSIICSLLFGDFAIIAHRLPYVFREFQIIIVSYLLSALPNKGSKIIGLSLIYIYAYIILSRFFTPDSIYNNYKNLLLI